jgi:anti-sigma B factor antagonist
LGKIIAASSLLEYWGLTVANTRDAALAVTVRRRGRRRVTVALGGELDLAAAPELEANLAVLVREGAVHVVLDLANLTFMDASGLSAMMATLPLLEQLSGSLTARNAPPHVFRVFEITGLVDLFSVTKLIAGPSDCSTGTVAPRCPNSKRPAPRYSTFRSGP